MSIDLKIILGKEAWQLYQIREKDERFLPYKESILSRDGDQCQFCGFKSDIYMNVVNVNHNYKDNKKDNLVTACPFCTQVHFLEMIGLSQNTGGTMIYLPEMSQSELNAFSHVLFCAIANSGDKAQIAQETYNSLKLRSKYVEQEVGKGLSDPAMLGQMLVDTPLDHSDYVFEETMRDLRVLPKLDAFSEQIKNWSQSAMEDLL
tara:strand:+ start:13218 stop:13829 length:612 start_codon:yes stop_codon:yes gene_type:complete